DSEIDELFKIFKIKGTPNDKLWPGVQELKDWKPSFPIWKPQTLESVVPHLDAYGLDLLSQMIEYDPTQRISAKRALQHPFFDDLKQPMQQQQNGTNPPRADLRRY
ncbi:Cyclin-dependent kinase 2, partial [Mortierella sp. NVP85]